MTLNGVIAIILRYFSEFGSFWHALRKLSATEMLPEASSF